MNKTSWSTTWQPSWGLPRPIAWPATMAPPVARAVKALIKSIITESISDTADTASSPTVDTMTESARPTNINKNCSIIYGIIRFRKSRLLNNRFIFLSFLHFIIRPSFLQSKEERIYAQKHTYLPNHLADGCIMKVPDSSRNFVHIKSEEWIMGFMKIFFFCGESSPDMPLLFIHI